MNEQKIHITAPISRDDLNAVIAGLEAACGGNRIEIAETFDLIVNDERQAAALEALFGGNEKRKYVPRNGGKLQGRATQIRPARRWKSARQSSDQSAVICTAPTRPPNLQRKKYGPIKAWRVFLPSSDGYVSEQITIEEKNLRLARGEFEPGTILHHPKAGRQRVTGAKGSRQGMEPESEARHD